MNIDYKAAGKNDGFLSQKGEDQPKKNLLKLWG